MNNILFLLFPIYYQGDKVKKFVLSEACSKHEINEKCEQNSSQKPKGRFGDLGVNAIYCIANKQVRRVWTRCSEFGIDTSGELL